MTPLDRFDDTTPPWVVRLVAVAPLPLFVGLAVVLRLTTTLPPLLALVALFCCAAWGSLPAGDLAADLLTVAPMLSLAAVFFA